MTLYRLKEDDDYWGMTLWDAVEQDVLVPVEPDEIKAADAFNAEMVRITGKSSAVEMRAIHAALRAGIGETP